MACEGLRRMAAARFPLQRRAATRRAVGAKRKPHYFNGDSVSLQATRKHFLSSAAAMALVVQHPPPIFAQLAVDGDLRLPPPDRKADPDIKRVLLKLLSFNEPPLPKLSPFAARNLASFADALQAVLSEEGKPCIEPVAGIRHIVIAGPGGELLLRVYSPAGAGPFPVVVYAHGGGFVIANLDTYDASARGLTNAAQAIVVSVAYRQAPEHPFPAAVEDMFAAYRWALGNAQSIGGDPSRVAVAGESAGGNLAAVASIVARNRNVKLPVHQLLVYPVTNFATDTRSYKTYADAFPLSSPDLVYFTNLYLPSPADAANPLASPLREKSLRGLPSATIINAEIDPLQDDGLRYAMRLAADGVAVNHHLYAGVTHEFFGMHAAVAKAQEALHFAAAGLRKAFGS